MKDRNEPKETKVRIYRSISVGDKIINIYKRDETSEEKSSVDTTIKSFGGDRNVSDD